MTFVTTLRIRNVTPMKFQWLRFLAFSPVKFQSPIHIKRNFCTGASRRQEFSLKNKLFAKGGKWGLWFLVEVSVSLSLPCFHILNTNCFICAAAAPISKLPPSSVSRLHPPAGCQICSAGVINKWVCHFIPFFHSSTTFTLLYFFRFEFFTHTGWGLLMFYRCVFAKTNCSPMSICHDKVICIALSFFGSVRFALLAIIIE